MVFIIMGWGLNKIVHLKCAVAHILTHMKNSIKHNMDDNNDYEYYYYYCQLHAGSPTPSFPHQSFLKLFCLWALWPLCTSPHLQETKSLLNFRINVLLNCYLQLEVSSPLPHGKDLGSVFISQHRSLQLTWKWSNEALIPKGYFCASVRWCTLSS